MSLRSTLSLRNWRGGIRGESSSRLEPTTPSPVHLATRQFVELAFELILDRRPDADGVEFFARLLDEGAISRGQFVKHHLITSPEFVAAQWKTGSPAYQARRFLAVLHQARVQMIKLMPKADVIVDLGGACEGLDEGALVGFGYPHTFQSLSIVDLPPELRHEIYANTGRFDDEIATPRGPVRYVYSSMADLRAFADHSVDLVWAGCTIEHVTREDADRVCRESLRILKPGGHFCLDTNNRVISLLQNPGGMANPDHEYEYTVPELADLLESHGFAIRETKGLVRFADSLATGSFRLQEGVNDPYLYDDAESCYLMYFRCQKPAIG
jgi:SAM-dependent methyltransferase